MQKRQLHLLAALLVVLLAISSMSITLAQDEPADIVNDEGGVREIVGTLTVEYPFTRTYTLDPVMILEDLAGFVDRNLDYQISPESQVMGQFTSEFFVPEPEVTFRFSLPIQPLAQHRDVDHDDTEEQGVQVFAVTMRNNRYGDVFIDQYDRRTLGDIGWSVAYSSGVFSEDPASLYELTSGTLLIYTADDLQSFSSSFGEDGLLFTEDDPTVVLPQGYTMVDLNSETFTFDRSNTVTMDTFEFEDAAADDFSELSYAGAFRALVEKARNEYAFTESKNIDWDALEAEFLPRFEEADDNNDAEAYLFALRDFAWSIPDGHIQVNSATNPILVQDFVDSTAGGLGLSLVELDDGPVVVNYILEDGPAEQANIKIGAEILEVDGVPIDEAIEATTPYSSPFSLDIMRRLQQLRYVLRFPLGTEVEITYQNRDDAEPVTVMLDTVEERDSFAYSSFNRGFDVDAPPVEYDFLDNGYGYVKVNSFAGDEPLMIETWEYFLNLANQRNAPGIIVDLRTNGGGFSFIGNRLASYFFNEDVPIGFRAGYNTDIDDFFYDERLPGYVIPPPDSSVRYRGQLAVLVGPGCASACEFFAYNFTLQDRAAIIGQYPTRGIGGGWIPTFMPEDVTFALPTSRPLDAEGNIMIESIGVVPTVVVPVTEDTVYGADDHVLNAAVEYLDEINTVDLFDGGDIAVGDTIEGNFNPGERVLYTLEVQEGDVINIYLEDDKGETDTVLRVYDELGNLLLVNDDNPDGGTVNSAFLELEIPADLTLVIEVGTFLERGQGPFVLRVESVGG